ncbi:MAG: hypothetical protein K6E93_06130 [Bacteroidales bacterium]|nr:hypothetical protein [Bacteroidales bacterium]
MLLACATMVAIAFGVSAQSVEKGSVMEVRVCDYDTLKADDTTILGYVFMEQYYLDKNIDTVVKKAYKPTMEDLRAAEKLLRSKYFYIMPTEKRDILGRETRPRLKWYTRQYVFGVDANGKKYAWINALRLENDSELTERASKYIIRIRDGGNYYWNVLLNIRDGKVLEVMINGGA